MVSHLIHNQSIKFLLICGNKSFQPCNQICFISPGIVVGFAHSAFTFAHESLVAKSTVSQSDVPPGALITFLQKGLEYVGIEEHIAEVSGVGGVEWTKHTINKFNSFIYCF